jgi:hypothetical protein
MPRAHLHVPIILKSGSLNLLEHSGPVQACNGVALPLPFTRSYTSKSHEESSRMNLNLQCSVLQQSAAEVKYKFYYFVDF